MLQHIKNWWLDNSLFIAIAVSLGVLFLSLLNSSTLPKYTIGVSDKVLHSFAYMVLIWSWLGYFYEDKSLRTKLILIISLTIFGIILELLQGGSLFNRTTDWKDVVANIIGLVLGALTFDFLFKLLGKKQPKKSVK